MPALSDPSFNRTVVYLLDHDQDSTLGVVLTNPSNVDVLDVTPRWWQFAAPPRRVHVGGPCQSDAALAVAVGRPGLAREGVRLIARYATDCVYMVDLDVDPDTLGNGLTGVRIFAGYAGWDSGQLAGEITEGAWVSIASRPMDVLPTDGEDLWRSVLDRQTGAAAFLHGCIEDPFLN